MRGVGDADPDHKEATVKKFVLAAAALLTVTVPMAVGAAPANAAATYTTGAPTTVVAKPTATSVKLVVKANRSRVISKATTIYKGSKVIARRATASGLKAGSYKAKTLVRYKKTVRRTSNNAVVRVLPGIKSVTRWNYFKIAAPAPAPCMSKIEWNAIHDGMTRAEVAALVGYYGTETSRTEYSDGEIDIDVDYRQCGSTDGTVWLSFSNWDYDYDYNTDTFRVDYKGSWSTW